MCIGNWGYIDESRKPRVPVVIKKSIEASAWARHFGFLACGHLEHAPMGLELATLSRWQYKIPFLSSSQKHIITRKNEKKIMNVDGWCKVEAVWDDSCRPSRNLRQFVQPCSIRRRSSSSRRCYHHFMPTRFSWLNLSVKTASFRSLKRWKTRCDTSKMWHQFAVLRLFVTTLFVRTKSPLMSTCTGSSTNLRTINSLFFIKETRNLYELDF